jgi:hypothetical protein
MTEHDRIGRTSKPRIAEAARKMNGGPQGKGARRG